MTTQTIPVATTVTDTATAFGLGRYVDQVHFATSWSPFKIAVAVVVVGIALAVAMVPVIDAADSDTAQLLFLPLFLGGGAAFAGAGYAIFAYVVAKGGDQTFHFFENGLVHENRLRVAAFPWSQSHCAVEEQRILHHGVHTRTDYTYRLTGDGNSVVVSSFVLAARGRQLGDRIVQAWMTGRS